MPVVIKVPMWKLDKAVDRLSKWGCDGTAFTVSNERVFVTTRRQRAWWTQQADVLTEEQLKALRAKAIVELTYPTTEGGLHLLVIPKKQGDVSVLRVIEREMADAKR